MSKYNKKINIQSNESEEETKKSIKTSNVEKMNSSYSNEETPVRRKEYDNIKKQTEVFNKLKILIKINEENRFNSFDVNASKEKLLNNLYFEIKEYFPPTIWYFRSNAKYQEMSLIRKMFKFFNFHITYNTTTRKINGEKVKGVNYLVTKKSTNI